MERKNLQVVWKDMDIRILSDDGRHYGVRNTCNAVLAFVAAWILAPIKLLVNVDARGLLWVLIYCICVPAAWLLILYFLHYLFYLFLKAQNDRGILEKYIKQE